MQTDDERRAKYVALTTELDALTPDARADLAVLLRPQDPACTCLVPVDQLGWAHALACPARPDTPAVAA